MRGVWTKQRTLNLKGLLSQTGKHSGRQQRAAAQPSQHASRRHLNSPDQGGVEEGHGCGAQQPAQRQQVRVAQPTQGRPAACRNYAETNRQQGSDEDYLEDAQLRLRQPGQLDKRGGPGECEAGGEDADQAVGPQEARSGGACDGGWLDTVLGPDSAIALSQKAVSLSLRRLLVRSRELMQPVGHGERAWGAHGTRAHMAMNAGTPATAMKRSRAPASMGGACRRRCRRLPPAVQHPRGMGSKMRTLIRQPAPRQRGAHRRSRHAQPSSLEPAAAAAGAAALRTGARSCPPTSALAFAPHSFQ